MGWQWVLPTIVTIGVILTIALIVLIIKAPFYKEEDDDPLGFREAGKKAGPSRRHGGSLC